MFLGLPGYLAATSIIGNIRNNLREIKYLPGSEDQMLAADAYMAALRGVFWTIFGLAAVGTVASLFMKEHTLHKDLARRQSR